MSAPGKRGLGRSVLVRALVPLWIAVLVLGFVAQTTELFGTRNGILAWLLLGVAALGFIVIGSVGIWLVVRGLDEPNASSTNRPAERGDA